MAAPRDLITPDTVRAALDQCAVVGSGPHQGDMFAAHRALAEAEKGDDCSMPEAALWVFLRDRYGWAVLEHEALEYIARKHPAGRLIDIGAGSGFVAACLIARGLSVEAVHLSGRWDKWWQHRFAPANATPASKLIYDADAYLLLMPDGGGEDMMAEALSRMPVGATAYVHAPLECSGSPRGHAHLQLSFERVAGLPLLNSFPWEASGRECGVFIKRRCAREADIVCAAMELALTAVPIGLRTREAA